MSYMFGSYLVLLCVTNILCTKDQDDYSTYLKRLQCNIPYTDCYSNYVIIAVRTFCTPGTVMHCIYSGCQIHVTTQWAWLLTRTLHHFQKPAPSPPSLPH